MWVNQHNHWDRLSWVGPRTVWADLPMLFFSLFYPLTTHMVATNFWSPLASLERHEMREVFVHVVEFHSSRKESSCAMGKMVAYARHERTRHMLHPYLTFADGTMVLHSDLKPDENGGRVLVHFERPTDEGFDSVRFELPSYEMTPWEGSFSDDELSGFRSFLAANAHLLYEFAAEGGLRIA